MTTGLGEHAITCSPRAWARNATPEVAKPSGAEHQSLSMYRVVGGLIVEVEGTADNARLCG